MREGNYKDLSDGEPVCPGVKSEQEQTVQDWVDNPLEIGHYDHESFVIKQHEPIS